MGEWDQKMMTMIMIMMTIHTQTFSPVLHIYPNLVTIILILNINVISLPSYTSVSQQNVIINSQWMLINWKMTVALKDWPGAVENDLVMPLSVEWLVCYDFLLIFFVCFVACSSRGLTNRTQKMFRFDCRSKCTTSPHVTILVHTIVCGQILHTVSHLDKCPHSVKHKVCVSEHHHLC